MFKLGLYLQTIDLTNTRDLLNLRAKIMIWSICRRVTIKNHLFGSFHCQEYQSSVEIGQLHKKFGNGLIIVEQGQIYL